MWAAACKKVDRIIFKLKGKEVVNLTVTIFPCARVTHKIDHLKDVTTIEKSFILSQESGINYFNIICIKKGRTFSKIINTAGILWKGHPNF